MTRTQLLPVVFLVLVVALSGCSGNKAAPARVSGSLSYNGKPIGAGMMKFHTADGQAYNAQISSDGTYTATDLPTGEMVVTVETESINPGSKQVVKTAEAQRRRGSMQQAPAGAQTPGDHYVKIPDKYSNSKTSPLTVTLTGGRQVHNIELTD